MPGKRKRKVLDKELLVPHYSNFMSSAPVFTEPSFSYIFNLTLKLKNIFPLDSKKKIDLLGLYRQLSTTRVFNKQFLREQRTKILASTNEEMTSDVKGFILTRLYSIFPRITIAIVRQERTAIRASNLTAVTKSDIILSLLRAADKNYKMPIDILQDERNAVLQRPPFQIRFIGMNDRYSYLQDLYRWFSPFTDEYCEEECTVISSLELSESQKKNLIKLICKGQSSEFEKRMQSKIVDFDHDGCTIS